MAFSPVAGYTFTMCGRYTLMTPWKTIADNFGLRISDVPELFVPRFNVAPSQQVLAVRHQDSDGREASYLKWEFIPSWSKDGKIAPINAMSETAAEKPMFRSAMKKRRCLVVADGFYEWRKAGKAKQPIHFRLKSREPFGFAGIWETWNHDDKAIETTEGDRYVTAPPFGLCHACASALCTSGT
jgi:putative SOS response-associated peptidase YedK